MILDLVSLIGFVVIIIIFKKSINDLFESLEILGIVVKGNTKHIEELEARIKELEKPNVVIKKVRKAKVKEE